MTPANGIHASVLRSKEWRCLCALGIRAASCAECVKCGMRRPLDTGAQIALTAAAIQALDVFRRERERHGNEVAAMGEVITWLKDQGGI